MSQYKTPDTPLAAYLIYLGFPLVDAKLNHNKYYFHFDSDHNGFQEAIFAFKSGNAQGNIPAYSDAYQRLVDIIKGR